MFAKLSAMLSDRYGVTVENAPKIAIIWAAEELLKVEPVAVVKKQLSAMNRKREKLGKIPACVPFGHPLF